MQIFITHYQTRVAKSTKQWAFLDTVEKKTGKVKENIMSPEDLEKTGFKPSMLSDVENLEFQPVECEFDGTGRISTLKPLPFKK